MITIQTLASRPEFIPHLADWAYRQWYGNRSTDFRLVVEGFRRRAQASIPLSWVALDDTTPVGMVSLTKIELRSRTDLSPWLSSLYVIPGERGKGIAGLLINTVVTHCSSLGLSDVYLFTGENNEIDLFSYYTARGWHFLCDSVDNDNRPTKILHYPLA